MIKRLTSFWLFGLLIIFNSCGLGENAGKVIFAEDSNEWFQEGRATWKFNGDQLVGTSLGGSGFVMTNKKYQNFTLSLEFYPDAGINSGIFVRCKNKEISNKDCYEMNIWDYHPLESGIAIKLLVKVTISAPGLMVNLPWIFSTMICLRVILHFRLQNLAESNLEM